METNVFKNYASQPRELRWRRFRSLSAAANAAPSGPGVYALGVRDAALGLPQSYSWAYVGKSLELKTRISRHQPRFETNPELRRWLLRNADNLEVWFAVTPRMEEDRTERLLIRTIKPFQNRILYKMEEYGNE